MTLARPTLGALAAISLAAGLLVAAPASAQPERERDGHHFPVSSDVTIPPGGNARLTTGSIGKGAKKMKVTVAPQPGATSPEKAVFDKLTYYVGELTTKGEKLLVCIHIHRELTSSWTDANLGELEVETQVLADLMLLACLEIAGLINQKQTRAPAPRSAAAATPCAKAQDQMPAVAEKTESGYRLTVQVEPKKAKKSPLRVGCRVKGKKIIFNYRAAKKGVPLHKVVGKKFRIGLESPPDAEASAPVRVTFNTS